jgi:hypothetical protein
MLKVLHLLIYVALFLLTNVNNCYVHLRYYVCRYYTTKNEILLKPLYLLHVNNREVLRLFSFLFCHIFVRKLRTVVLQKPTTTFFVSL